MTYGGVLGVGVIGALIARFKPHGMARAMVAVAIAQALVVVIALIIGKHQVEVKLRARDRALKRVSHRAVARIGPAVQVCCAGHGRQPAVDRRHL